MPNHVTSICTITGEPSVLALFVEKHIASRQCQKHDDCKGTTELGIACLNWREFCFRTVIPRPAVLDDTISPDRPDHAQNRKAEAETGYSNWYDWSLKHWGTKWGAYDYEERERAKDRFVFKFETAWSFPEPIFRKLAELYPELTFDIVSFDEGWNSGCEGQFNGRNDYREDKDLATAKFYERVYGRKPPSDDDQPEAETGGDSR